MFRFIKFRTIGNVVVLVTILFIISQFAFAGFTEQYAGTLTNAGNGSVAWGDYDNDGKLDILMAGFVSSGNYVTKIYHNTGSGFSEAFAGQFPGIQSCSVAWGDYDNDGKLDFIIVGYSATVGANITKIYHNTGSGFTEVYAGQITGLTNSSVAWGDYDNDGKLDIAVSGLATISGTQKTKIYRNTGAGFTEVYAGQLRALSNSSITWCDYDNDGKLDIFLTGADYANAFYAVLYHNTGSGFTEVYPGQFTPVFAGSVAWGDYDSDGRLDILLTGMEANTNKVAKIYRNTGTGFVEVYAGQLTGVSSSSVAWSDFDNDGRLDILLTGFTNSATRVSKIYQNTGTGFTEVFAGQLAGMGSGSVAWGDYDNDGKVDILMAGYTGSGYISKIYQNTTTTANTKPSAPTGLTATAACDTVQLRWNRSTDAQTLSAGLSYNISMGATSHSATIVNPLADSSTGWRRVVRLGNTNADTSWTIKNLSPGNYYWSVQAIDQVYAGSVFSSEGTFSIMPVFSNSVTSKDFGTVNLSSAATDSITVTNTGNDTLTISSVTKGTDQYSVTPASGNLAPSVSMKFYITFTPTSTGLKTDTLNFIDNASGSPHKIFLQGTCVNPQFSVSPTSLEFGNVRLGINKIDSITVSNPGSGSLTISSISNTDGEYTVTPSFGTINAGSSMNFFVTFAPLSGGSKDDTIRFIHNAVDSPGRINIRGTGIPIITSGTIGNGSVTPGGELEIAPGSTSVFNITPEPGYHIDSVIIDGINEGIVSSKTFTNVLENHTVIAYFSINYYPLTVSTVGNGSVIKYPDQINYPYGTTVRLTAIQGTGYHFVEWSEDLSGNHNPDSIIISTDKSVTAHFEIDQFSITATSDSNGSIFPSGITTVDYGSSQRYSFMPSTGYHLESLIVDGVLVDSTEGFTFDSITGNHSIHAGFAIDLFTISASSGANGAISPAGITTVPYGGSQIFTFLPHTGYHVDSLFLDGVLQPVALAETLTNITAGHTIYVTFAINKYVVTASAGANGSISPAGLITANYGTDTTVTFSPGSGFIVDSIIVDGIYSGDSTSYQFVEITSDHSIHVTFTEAQVTIYTNHRKRWNLVSNPVKASNDSLQVLYPDAISNAFVYEGEYHPRSRIQHGIGYWLKFSNAEEHAISGLPLHSDTVDVLAGWNIIGSLSQAIQTSNIGSIPPGIATSQFYKYSGRYSVVTAIEPGNGYWVKVNQDGKLVLNSSSGMISLNKISILPTSELPPSPPEDDVFSNEQELPTEFSLKQNYPNPFNPATTIRYAITGQPVLVTLRMYNTLGQEVATLINEVQDAGYKTVQFNAGSLPSGVYLYKLHAGEYMDVKKLLLMK